jgi:pimeloyl-ACP methyl ester carboxylesterase
VTQVADGPVVYHRAATDDGAPRVVFVHGSMDRGGSFIKTARRLPDLDIVRYDRSGYGRSVHLEPVPTIAAQVDERLEVIGDEPSLVVGHSLGGVIALAAAERRPDLVRGVVAYEAPTPWASWWPTRSAGRDAMQRREESGAAEAAERFMRRMIGDERWTRLPPSTREARRAEGPALVTDLRLVQDGRFPYDAGSIAVPVVVGAGSQSLPHHQRSATELATSVPGAELVVIDGADHGAHFTHPDEFADLVRRAVAREDDGGPVERR